MTGSRVARFTGRWTPLTVSRNVRRVSSRSCRRNPAKKVRTRRRRRGPQPRTRRSEPSARFAPGSADPCHGLQEIGVGADDGPACWTDGEAERVFGDVCAAPRRDAGQAIGTGRTVDLRGLVSARNDFGDAGHLVSDLHLAGRLPVAEAEVEGYCGSSLGHAASVQGSGFRGGDISGRALLLEHDSVQSRPGDQGSGNRPVPVRQLSMTSGRYWRALSLRFTARVTSPRLAAARLPMSRLTSDQTPSVRLRSGA